MDINPQVMNSLNWKIIFKSWPGLFFILDQELNILMTSTEFVNRSGQEGYQFEGRNIAEIYNFYTDNTDKNDLRWRLSQEYILQSRESHRLNPVRFTFYNIEGQHDIALLRPIQVPVFDEDNQLLYIIHRFDPAHPWDAADPADDDRLNLMSQLINDGIYEMDFTTEKVWWNDQLYRMLGYQPEEISLGVAEMLRTIHHDDRRRVFNLIRGKVHNQSDFQVEYRLRKKGGVYIDVSSKVVIIRNEKGEPLKFLAAIHDVSHYKEQIRLKARLELITSTIPAMICYISKDLKYEFLNSAYKNIYGDNIDKLIGQPVADYVDYETYKRFISSARRVLSGERVQVEYGSLRNEYFKTWYIPDKDDKGQVRGFIGLTMDMTKEKHKEIDLNNATREKQRLVDQLSLAHEHLNREKKVLKDFFMEAPSLIAIYEGPDFTLKYMNRRASEMYGHKLKVGIPLTRMPAKLSYQKIMGIFQHVYDHQTEYRAREFMIKSATITDALLPEEHSEHYFDFVVQCTKDIAGHSTGLIIYANEVTDQVMAKKALQEVARRDRLMLEAMPIIAYIYNAHGKIEYLNSKWYDYTGDYKGKAMRLSLKESLHPDDTSKSMIAWRHSLNSGTIYNEYLRIKGVDGKYKWHYTRVVPVKDENDKIIRWIGTSTDIDEQVNANERKDEFISIASHELKTPLTSVMAYLQLTRELFTKSGEPAANYLDKAYKNSEKLNNLISELLDVSRIQSGKMLIKNQTFEFDKMVQDVVESHQHASTTHQISLRGASNIVLTGDQERLERVLHNLLSNAIKYSPGEDRVTVEIGQQNGAVRVSVTDYGIGVSDKDQKHLFSQFYRSDKVSKGISGLGIGLFISQEIARLHGGNISLISTEGNGSSFTLELPCT